jgi:hypothetical protein
LGIFWLVTVGPPRGVPLGVLGGAVEGFVEAPYKLFEVVEGAVLNVSDLQPGRPVFVEREVVTPIGRRFRYRASARASMQGVAQIQAPYAGAGYTVRTDSGSYQVSVKEDEVVSGLAVEVP